MKIKKLTRLLNILFIIILFLSSYTVSSENISNKSFESHLVKGVPYVSQETNFYCGFATPTMIFKYLGINTTLHEVVYNSGVGYSLMYPSLKDNRLPYSGWITSQELVTCEFLSDLYGLNFSFWKNQNYSFEDIWEEYWLTVKQNISKDIPIAAVVEEVVLVVDNLGFEILSKFTDSLPYSRDHFILLLGFNESNQTVCYNDPMYGLINKSEYGTYRWVNLTKFKTSAERVSNRLYLKIFENSNKDQLSKQEAFNISHKRNIEKLKGNFSVYFDEFSGISEEDNYSLGINAVKILNNDFGKGLDKIIKTFYQYKLNNRLGLFYKLMKFLSYKNFLPELDKLILEPNDVFESIAIEKRYVSDYLREIKSNLTDENLINICTFEISLFNCEAENWTYIANYYSEFRKKGVFLPLPKGLSIINKMSEALDNIIKIEEEIITGPSS